MCICRVLQTRYIFLKFYKLVSLQIVRKPIVNHVLCVHSGVIDTSLVYSYRYYCTPTSIMLQIFIIRDVIVYTMYIKCLFGTQYCVMLSGEK